MNDMTRVPSIREAAIRDLATGLESRGMLTPEATAIQWIEQIEAEARASEEGEEAGLDVANRLGALLGGVIAMAVTDETRRGDWQAIEVPLRKTWLAAKRLPLSESPEPPSGSPRGRPRRDPDDDSGTFACYCGNSDPGTDGNCRSCNGAIAN